MERGGAQKNVYNLIQKIDIKKFEINLLTFSEAKECYYNLSNIKKKFLNLSFKSNNFFHGILNNLKRILILRNFIKENNPDTILSFIYTTNILVILASVFLKKKIIVCERNDPKFQKISFFWNSLRKIFYGKASFVTVNSMHAKKYLLKYVDDRKLKYLPNFTITKKQPQKKIRLNNFILAIGRLEYQKGFDLLINDFTKISQKKSDLKLVILGEGSQLNNLKKLVPKSNKNIIFAGNQDSVAYFNSCKVFVLSSRFEGTPNVLIEAMSFEKPIIIYKNSIGISEYVRDMKEAIILDQNPVMNTLDKALIFIRENNKEIKKISMNAKKKFLELNNEEIFRSWLKILD